MASRGRHGVPAREGEQRRDEPRREDQGEQQAPAPQGPVLPPPPPVDYGVFMQGLVQAMQTQAYTQAALQAQLEAQQAQAQVPVPQADYGGPSIMEQFKRMSPPSFKGESDPLLAESWMREIEKIFRAIRCAEDDKVTFATYMLQERADVWWSSLLRTRFEDGAVEIGWDELVAFDHRTLEQALSAACRQEGEMEQYLEEKKAFQKRPTAPFQRQERKKAAFQSPQRHVASGSSQVPSQRSPSGKKECPHCGRAHGGTECWKLVGKCLKYGSSKHRIKDCLRLQQGGQHGTAPAPAAAAPATRRPGRPRAPARVFALAREDAEQADHVASLRVRNRVWGFRSLFVCAHTRRSGNASGNVALGLGNRPPTASSGVLQRLEESLNIGEDFYDTYLRSASTQNSNRGNFEDSLALAEEGFSGLNLSVILYALPFFPCSAISVILYALPFFLCFAIF
ncbi:hypothetical protein Taro_041133 [Colocasia esculenta]|uniref:Gag protein n=1 Tax=Colocasia esculenta TaxID=4460 RepID=A0A843WUY9_COLES|nr:hypothetical protein [Colocasia esculenta]